ncbi:hypothetical protein ABR759_00290 [Escherichia coli]
MMTVKTDVYVFLFRITIVWPSMLTGCVMMLYFAEVAGGGVAGLEQRYGVESARWRDAPEGMVMTAQCPSRPFMAPVSAGEWRALAASDDECSRVPRSFREAAEGDVQSLRRVALTLLLASVVLEALSACILRRVTASVRVSPHCGYGCGRGAVAHWPESRVHAAPEKGERV